MDVGTITAISGGVAATVAVLELLRRAIQRGQRSTPTATHQSESKTSNEPQPNVIPTNSALHQLPPPPADFTGRIYELARLEEQVHKGGATISGVRGMGGVGKTALALELARRLTPKFPDAQFYLDLKGTTQPLTPAEAMAHVIRSYNREASLPESEGELQGLYHSVLQGQRALLLMDNALDADQVQPLIPPEGCVMLVTSRQRFDLPGLYPLDLDTLTPEDARGLLLLIAPRIGDQADEIAQRCGYLPLALRLAGGAMNQRVNLSPEDYLRRLEDAQTRLELVDASLTSSYDLLPPELQESWAALSVFPDSFNYLAAAAVWEVEEDPAQDRLGDLINYSLVDYIQESQRYRLHDLARLVADSQLVDDGKGLVQLRHAKHFNGVLEDASSLYLESGGSIILALSLFDRERANIQTGQAWAANCAGKDSRAAALCAAYAGPGPILGLRLHPHQRVVWMDAAVTAARIFGNRELEAHYLGNLGIAYSDMGEPRRAIEHYEQQLVITREIGDRHGEGTALGNLGICYTDLGEADQAIQVLKDALGIFKELGDFQGECSCLGNLGVAFSELDDSGQAIQQFEQQIVLARQIGDLRGVGNALGGLGIAYFALGDFPRAIDYHEQQLVSTREIGNRIGEVNALGSLGNAYGKLKEHQTAIEYRGRSLEIAREIGDRRGEGIAHCNMALDYHNLGDLPRAIGHAEAALPIYEQVEHPDATKLRERLAAWRREEGIAAGCRPI